MKAMASILLAVAILLLVPFDIVTFDTLVEVMVVLAIVFGLATIFYLSMCLVQSNYKDWKRKKKWGWS